MKKNILKLTAISSAVLLVSTSSAMAAGMPTFDAANAIQNTITAAKSTITAAQATLTSGYTWLTAQASAANGMKIGQTTEAVKLAQKQSVLNVQDQDMRNRKAMGNAEFGKMGRDMLPTLAACVEASRSVPGAPATSAMASAGRNTDGGANGSTARSLAVKTTAAGMAEVLRTKTTLGTCSAETMGAGGCTTPGPYAGADIHPRGLFGNVRGIDPTKEGEAAYNNGTLDAQGWEVVKKYASDAAYANKPKVATPEQLKKNPAYAVMYSSIQTKLDAANSVIKSLGSFRRPGATDLSATIPGAEWAKITPTQFKNATGFGSKPTGAPSLYDVVNYEVKSTYFGTTQAKQDSLIEVNKRLAMSNFLSLQKIEEQEKTNLLLAHMLIQLTTPVSKDVVDNEHSKTMNLK